MHGLLSGAGKAAPGFIRNPASDNGTAKQTNKSNPGRTKQTRNGARIEDTAGQ